MGVSKTVSANNKYKKKKKRQFEGSGTWSNTSNGKPEQALERNETF